MDAHHVLLVVALILWFVAAIPIPAGWPAFQLGWLGNFFAGLAFFISK